MIRQFCRIFNRLGVPPRPSARRPLALLALFLLASAPVLAQFSGPPTITNPTNNFPPPAATTDPAILYPPVHDVYLNPGDLIAIKVFLQPEFSTSTRISTDGTIFLPLLGVIHLAGITVRQAEQLLAEKFISGGIYNDPQVTVDITEGPNSVVTFIGEIHSVVPLTGTRRLLEIISQAGGIPSTASHMITIHRPSQPNPIIIDLGIDPLTSQLADVPVFAGDTIVISRIGSVIMMGSFKSPGAIALSSYAPLTLLQATAVSGGPMQDAKLGDLRIIRTVGDRRTVVKLNISDVEFGKAPDPYLQPNDIVFLPQSAIKAVFFNGTLGTFLGIFGLAYGLLH